MFFDSIKVEENHCFDDEQKTILQSNPSVWFNLREFLKPEMEKKLPKVLKGALKHGKLYECTARQNYTQYLKFVFKHNINVRETGLVIQPNLFSLAASPDGLVPDHSDSRKVCLIEIKCPKSNCNNTPQKRHQTLCTL